MISLPFPPRSLEHSDRVARSRAPSSKSVCRGGHEGLDVGTKNSDFPVRGEKFPLTSPFIERRKSLTVATRGAEEECSVETTDSK